MNKPTLEELRAEYERQNAVIDALCISLDREGAIDVPEELYEAVTACVSMQRRQNPLLTLGQRA